jgi:putative sugar O-methyltransferase
MIQENPASHVYPSGLNSHYLAAIVSGDAAALAGLRDEAAAEAMMLAAANGQIGILQGLHGAGCALPAGAMAMAAANGRLDVVRYLCEQRQHAGEEDNRAIRAAALANHLGILKYLHQHGADLKACANSWETLALLPSARPVVTYLARHDVATDGPRLMILLHALRTEPFSAIHKVIENFELGAYSAPIVRVAAERGDADIMKLLHQRGCNLLAGDQTAFRIAAAHGHIALLGYLHDNGTNLHAGDDEALKIAAESGHIIAVAFLAERGADIRKIDDATLALIQFSGHTRTFNYLTDSGLDAIRNSRPMIEAMQAELGAAKPVYRPSKLWEFFNEVNLEQLRRSGLQGFKRSVNQNYFNFLPYSLLDPQLLQLAKWWLHHPSLTLFKTKVFDPDILPLSGLLLPVDRRVFSLGSGSHPISLLTKTLRIESGRKIQIALYRLLMAMLWDYTWAHDKLGLVQRLSEPRTGSPIDVYVGSTLASQDLAHSILECNSIFGAISPEERSRISRVAEVGAGYGRLAHVLMRTVHCRYVVFDIPPGLLISQWYLGETFPDKQIFHFRHFDRFEEIAGELEQADIAFFTPNQIEQFPEGYFDLAINISSLHELRPDQIENMLGQIYRVTRGHVYLKQYKEYHNPYDGLRILEDCYKLAPGWKHRYYRDDDVDSRFFETLIEYDAGASLFPTSRSRPTALTVVTPTVSILLANYNHAKYLPTSLAGICGQTRPATEIIIVDDGSTDDSIAVIEEYTKRFPQIRLLRNGINRGQHYSIQRALLAARSNYIVWAASDDLLLPDFIGRSLQMLQQNPGAGLCFSQLAVFVDGTTETRHYTGATQGVAFDYGEQPRLIPPTELKSILSQHYLWLSGNTVMARRDALLEIGGFAHHLKWHGDWFAFYVIALRHGACVIPETLAMMRERQDTYSKTGMDNLAEQTKVLTALFDTVKSAPYRDLLPVFMECPSLLGLFGRRALYTALRHPRHWNIACRLAPWLIPRYLLRMYGTGRHRLSSQFNRLYCRLPGDLRNCPKKLRGWLISRLNNRVRDWLRALLRGR